MTLTQEWSGLGTQVTAPTMVQGFEEAGLDWTSQLAPLRAKVRDRNFHNPFETEIDSYVVVDDWRAQIRTDTGTVLGIVGKDYKILQSRELAEFADHVSDQSGGRAVPISCGQVAHGRRVFCILALTTVYATEEDRVEAYILLSNGNGTHSGFSGCLLSFRPSCLNVLAAPVSAMAAGFKIAHVGDMAAKIEEARKVFHKVTEDAETYEIRVRQLASRRVRWPSEYFKDVFNATFPAPSPRTTNPDEALELAASYTKRRTDVIASWDQNYQNELIAAGLDRDEGNLWLAFNAVSEWHDHQRGRLTDGSEARTASNLFGVSARHKAIAWKAALRLV